MSSLLQPLYRHLIPLDPTNNRWWSLSTDNIFFGSSASFQETASFSFSHKVKKTCAFKGKQKVSVLDANGWIFSHSSILFLCNVEWSGVMKSTKGLLEINIIRSYRYLIHFLYHSSWRSVQAKKIISENQITIANLWVNALHILARDTMSLSLLYTHIEIYLRALRLAF